ncbi:MAG TPA: CvpA family protein [Chloroflexia bacterium]|nr:CvpA family protein [Chloroflexia bacterium]
MSWPDLLVIGVVIFSAFLATRRGFVAVMLSLGGFVLALVVAFNFFLPVADLLTQQFGWALVWTRPLAFVGLWVLSQAIFEAIERLVIWRMGYRLRESQTNRLLAIIPGAVQGILVSAVILTLLALTPQTSNNRNVILKSALGGKLVSATLAVERPLEGIFGPAAREALGFITVAPPTGTGRPGEQEVVGKEGIQLEFTVDDATADPDNETAMLALVNQERTSRGLNALEMDPELRLVARAHADDMFKRGYFAHDTPEGVDPFDRMRDANIVFGLAGENLALAPTLDIAHNGLMNSPGHRANILKDGFNKVGIGVLDGGIYGKMWVQEFSD